MGTEWKRERNGRGLWYEASEKGIVGISDAYVRERCGHKAYLLERVDQSTLR